MDLETMVNPDQEVIDLLDRGLHAYNVAHVGQAVVNNYYKLAVVAKGIDGQIIGGIHGDLIWEWLYIQTLWVDEAQRGQGIGSQLLTTIEALALSKGFGNSHLETTSFQALGFYQKHGYEIFGELEGKPAGTTWYFLKKQL